MVQNDLLQGQEYKEIYMWADSYRCQTGSSTDETELQPEANQLRGFCNCNVSMAKSQKSLSLSASISMLETEEVVSK